jgi:release factor glutamine methyltransferase
MSEPRTVAHLLRVAERVLADSTHIFDDHDNAREAEELLAHCLKVDHGALDASVIPNAATRDRYLALIARRAGGEPFPFLTGHIEFYGLDLKVKPGAFVPRPSSELIVGWAEKRLKKIPDAVVVDICAGAAPIALALAHEFPKADVWALDIATEALAQGRANARRLGIENITMRAGDMFGPLPRSLKGKVDLVTGHVPYVPFGELEDLPTEVLEYEPVYTLTDESGDGLGLMRRAVTESTSWLKPGGWLELEMSDDISEVVMDMCRDEGFMEVGEIADDDELSVVVEGRRPG